MKECDPPLLDPNDDTYTQPARCTRPCFQYSMRQLACACIICAAYVLGLYVFMTHLLKRVK
jgi:hypothetical protein